MKIAVLHHNDLDGFGAAFAAWKAFGATDELLFLGVQYSQPAPFEKLAEFAPDHIYIVDFCYDGETLLELSTLYPGLIVIDHHKTAKEQLLKWMELGGCGAYIHDVSKSGCMLAWEFFMREEASEPAPPILHYVEDRDLWLFELENSKEINAFIATLPNDFEVWDDFDLPEAYTAGRAILAFQARQIESRVKRAQMIHVDIDDGVAMKLLGSTDGWTVSPRASISSTDCAKHLVPIVNASENISELGSALCAAYPEAPFSISYCDRPDGNRSYALRSRNGFDVSEVAKAFGGGGHPGAAGFTLPSPKII